MEDTPVDLVRAYIQEHAFTSVEVWDKNALRKRSYREWAAYELIGRMMDQPFTAPLDVIDEFMTEMWVCACLAASDPVRDLWIQVALDTANDIAILFV